MNILEVTTQQAESLRILFDALKDILLETSIEFNTESGMKISKASLSKTMLINVKLSAENFSTFMVQNNKLIAGIDLRKLYKLIEGVNNYDTLTLCIEGNNKYVLNVKTDNFKKNKNTISNLNLLDLVDPELTFPVKEFDAVITMNSKEFHKICSDMNQIGKYVEIKCSSDKLIFTCEGDFGNTKITYTSKDESSVKVQTPGTKSDVQGLYHLDDLILFSPYVDLCKDIHIYMMNDFPLVIKYIVGTLGHVCIFFAPINRSV